MAAGQRTAREAMHCVSHEQVQKLLHNKFVLVLGDSIQRSVYKDIVLLLQKDKYLSVKQLKSKGEMSFEQDCLVEGGCLNVLHNGTQYTEVRQYQSDHHLVRFYFVTRVFSAYMRSIIEDLRHGLKPDIVIANSCVWDISRYNASWLDDYRQNLDKFFDEMKSVLPEETLIIWNLTMPLAERIKGGFLVPEIEHKAPQLRYDVIEGNFYSGTLADMHGLDVLDLHFQFRFSLHHRTSDGVHWNAIAHRKITSLLLEHAAQAWGVDMTCPLRAIGQCRLTERDKEKENEMQESGQSTVELENTQVAITRPAHGNSANRAGNRANRAGNRANRAGNGANRAGNGTNRAGRQVWCTNFYYPPANHLFNNMGFVFRPPHQPYNEHHHQQVMRSRRSRYHYAPYSHHRANQYSHNGQYY